MRIFHKKPARGRKALPLEGNCGGNGGVSHSAKYIGGHPALTGGETGILTVSGGGVFFGSKKDGRFIFVPAEKILGADFETGEKVARNAVFSRLLALGGFAFAYRQKTREKRMFLTIGFVENGVEVSALFETPAATELAGAIVRIRQEANAKRAEKPEPQKSVSELMLEINELRALGIISSDEFIQKKKELLSRI